MTSCARAILLTIALTWATACGQQQPDDPAAHILGRWVGQPYTTAGGAAARETYEFKTDGILHTSLHIDNRDDPANPVVLRNDRTWRFEDGDLIVETDSRRALAVMRKGHLEAAPTEVTTQRFRIRFAGDGFTLWNRDGGGAIAFARDASPSPPTPRLQSDGPAVNMD